MKSLATDFRPSRDLGYRRESFLLFLPGCVPLGYIFLRYRRKRRVIFVGRCWLNINARFPEGAALEGANTALMGALLKEGVGIIRTPCPEYLFPGLEKYNYGTIIGEELTACFRKAAETVVSQVKVHLALGFAVAGIMGTEPSPSCGVETTKAEAQWRGPVIQTTPIPSRNTSGHPANTRSTGGRNPFRRCRTKP